MNQILFQCNFENSNLKSKKKFIIILIFAILSIVIAVSTYFIKKNKNTQNEKISKHLISNFSIMTLYSNSTNDYSSTQVTTEDENKHFVIGLIQIDAIELTYPILSTSTEELLKISPCKFYGPMPNNVGNLCIAGHNYVDNKHFGKINYLKLGDTVKIYDLSGNFIEYIIYDKKEISADDLSCTSQETNNLREITLITCNNIKGNRLCIKAKEI